MIHELFPVETYEDIRRLRESINSAFNNISAAYPPCSIYEGQDKTTLRFFAPGMSVIDVVATPDSLTLTVERIKTAENQTIKEERISGSFKRTVNFPFKVNTEKYEAVYKNGVITLTFERAEEDKPKKIKIK